MRMNVDPETTENVYIKATSLNCPRDKKGIKNNSYRSIASNTCAN